jgi:5-methylcytosine-specific restriction endonuclease McrA
MRDARSHRVLAIVATDRTFEKRLVRGELMWVGKCLHCGSTLCVALDGDTRGQATIEHILPRGHGGTDELTNLALACARCNQQKGVRLDSRPSRDPRLNEVVERLAAKRRERWRAPDGGEGQDSDG